MVFVRRPRVVAAVSVALLSAAVLVPASMTMAAETPATPAATAELPLLSDPAPALAIQQASVEAASAIPEPVAKNPDAETLCMAKVVHHEAGNQPRAGKLAVAQTILNRVESGRFADTVCGVVHQRNQYFDTTRYHPRTDSASWASALAVAVEARSGKAEAVVPGALFFRAGYAAPSSFFRSRTRVASVGDHVFYR